MFISADIHELDFNPPSSAVSILAGKDMGDE